MTTPTNGWDLVLGLNQDFLSGLTSSLYESGRIPSSFSGSFSQKNRECQLELELSEPTIAFVGGDSAGACSFTGDAQLVAATVPVTGTMTCSKGSPQKLEGTVTINMNLAEMVLSAVGWADYLRMGGGPGESADCGSLGAFAGAGCTLEAWVRTSSKAFQTIMLFGAAAPSLSLEDDTVRLYWGGDFYDSNDQAGAPLSDGEWHHVAVTVDDAGLISFYKDGQFKSSIQPSGEQQPAGALQLGAAFSYPSGDASAFDGDIAQVRVWDYARSAAQLQQAMNTTLAGDQDGLLGCWTFAGGAVVNSATGGAGEARGGAQVVNLSANEIPYSLNLYFLNPDNVFCTSCDTGDEVMDEAVAGTIQKRLDGATGAPADLGTVSPSPDSKAPALLPTYAATTLLPAPPGDPSGAQLVAMAVTQHRPQPTGDPAAEFAGDAAVLLPPGSNLMLAVWDYFLFDSLFVPALAEGLGTDESNFSVSQDPVVLTLNEGVGDLLGLTMKITSDGLYVESATKARPVAIPWIVTLSLTAGVSVKDLGSGKEQLIFTALDPSIEFEPDESGPAGWVLEFPIFAALAALFAELWELVIGSWLKTVTQTKTIDSEVFTLTDIVFNGGILVFADFTPEAAAQAAPDAPAREETEAAVSSAAPVISGFSPAAGDDTTLVTVRGAGFGGASSVRFNGATASYFRAKSDAEILARPGPGASSGPISVTTPAGTAVSQASFEFLLPPVIDGFSDPDEVHLPGDPVTITGSNFAGAASVSFGVSKVAAAGFSVNAGGTQITAAIPDGAVSGPVYVVAPGGQGASSQPILIGSAQAPAIIGFSPAEGAPQSAVTIDGQHFAGTEWVSFNDVPAVSFTLLDDTQLIAYVPVSAQPTPGPIAVTNNQGTSLSAENFTVTPPPSILSLEPASGGLGQAVTIKGSNLGGATAVTFGKNLTAAEFEVLSDSEIAARVPAGAVSGRVAVTTPSGIAASDAEFTVVSAAPPADLSFTPAAGGPGAPVTISGLNFTGATGVSFNGALASYVVQSDTELVAYVPENATTGPVEVTNSANPLTPTKSAQAFEVYAPPEVSALQTTKGKAGESLKIKGANFGGATSVTVGAGLTPAEPFTVSSDGATISTTVPSGATSGRITVTTPGGTAVSDASFTVESSAAPADITFSPAEGSVGAEVSIEGKNFTGTTAVTFSDGVRATSVRVESDTAITARVPQGAATGRVAVTNTAGSASSAEDFTVESASGGAPTRPTPEAATISLLSPEAHDNRREA